MVFISHSYGMFYLSAKSLLRHWQKIVLITWLLSGTFWIFNMVSRRMQQLHFAIYSKYDHCFLYTSKVPGQAKKIVGFDKIGFKNGKLRLH